MDSIGLACVTFGFVILALAVFAGIMALAQSTAAAITHEHETAMRNPAALPSRHEHERHAHAGRVLEFLLGMVNGSEPKEMQIPHESYLRWLGYILDAGYVVVHHEDIGDNDKVGITIRRDLQPGMLAVLSLLGQLSHRQQWQAICRVYHGVPA